MEKVNLRLAFCWTCEDCGIDKFERGIYVDKENLSLDDPEVSKIVNEDPPGVWLFSPTTVFVTLVNKPLRQKR
jgi:hypothetical protein